LLLLLLLLLTTNGNMSIQPKTESSITRKILKSVKIVCKSVTC